MKTLLIFFLLTLPISVFAQQPDVGKLQWDGENLVHQTVIDLPGLDPKAIFSGAKKYLISAFKNYKEVVSSEDESLGQIAGSGITTSSYQGIMNDTWDIRFNFLYEIKAEKIRITFSNFESLAAAGSPAPLEMFTINGLSKKPLKKLQGVHYQIFDNLGMKFDEMNEDFKKSLEKSDDW